MAVTRGDRRRYVADALMADLSSFHHHVRAASEGEAERRMRARYPTAARIFLIPCSPGSRLDEDEFVGGSPKFLRQLGQMTHAPFPFLDYDAAVT